MCGIYGSTKIYREQQVKDKLERTGYRGPDMMGWQYYEYDDCHLVFGHNRLAIIDLDSRSNQPFTYHNKVEIVFNGEIYNFRNIRSALSKKGYTFHTLSDTEVICAAYLEYGTDCVKHFNGMFAFVIFDIENRKLFGARDRLGQKPFYYYHNGLHFEFASQISSIQLHNQNLSVSRRSIEAYLTWDYIPDPYSIFNEIKKLKPGHTFTYNIANGQMHSECYWDIDFKNERPFLGDYNQAKSELKSLLSDAVKMRLFADVPVGVFLSGGVDSSLIAALATQTSDVMVKTFSVKFNEAGFDESSYAQKVADHLGTDHNVIECNYDEGLSLIENFHHYYDEPFADSSAIPSMLLSKHTKDYVTVALSGDAGDESFLGYGRYHWANTQSRIYKIPLPLRRALSKLLMLSKNYKANVISKALEIKDVNSGYMSVLNGVDQSWINSQSNHNLVEELKYLDHNNKNLLERISDFDIKTYLNWDINTKVDRASMAFSLEVRAPLMDYRVVDFARSIPTDFKFNGNNQKRILKDVLYDYVPSQIFDRPKAGFTMPFSVWFRTNLKDYVMSELDDKGLEKIPGIDIEKVKFRIKQHMDGDWDRYPLIWKLLVLKQWLNHNAKHLSVK
ncbi:asparagine synthase (glutamine-hydrolyzing) [Winogradskyella sp. A2]|uniref:asparagine synthase (glutamine-hydrolyzing) n=1 Tax=Winogradskyella sp. A2 TaxID=3366944 RepID=UPI00398C6766